jgi:putative membrane protein
LTRAPDRLNRTPGRAFGQSTKEQRMTKQPRPFLGLLAGVAAGLVASAAMAAFQAQAQKLLPDQGGSDDDPATVKAADQVSQAAIGDPVPEPYREQAGQAVHYIVGGVLGGIYGVLTEYQPEASSGFGSAYGIATAALLDEAAVPAVGLGPTPAETPLSTHAYGAASHLVYGFVLEGIRSLLVGRR